MPEARPGSAPRAALAALLNAFLCLPGAGYALLGQWRKAGLAALLGLLGWGLDVLASALGSALLGHLAFPLLFTFQLLCGLDAWLLGRERRRPPPRATRVALLAWLGGEPASSGSGEPQSSSSTSRG